MCCPCTKVAELEGGPVIDIEPVFFERLVALALDTIPKGLADRIDNVVIVVEDESPGGMPTLLGLYQGIPLTSRTPGGYAGALPDRITIYRRPILAICNTPDEVVEEVRRTVVHEVGHHFGMDDRRLHELGY